MKEFGFLTANNELASYEVIDNEYEIVNDKDTNYYWFGKKNKVSAVVAEDIYSTIPKRKKRTIKAVIEYNGPIEAPISKGDKIGLLNIYVSGELKKEIDIFSGEEIKRANIFSRLLKSFNFLVWGDV